MILSSLPYPSNKRQTHRPVHKTQLICYMKKASSNRKNFQVSSKELCISISIEASFKKCSFNAKYIWISHVHECALTTTHVDCVEWVIRLLCFPLLLRWKSLGKNDDAPYVHQKFQVSISIVGAGFWVTVFNEKAHFMYSNDTLLNLCAGKCSNEWNRFESDEVGYLSDWKALYGLNLA